MKILVTGAAGFIGFFAAKQLLERGDAVVGLDNFNDYYDVSLKEARAAILDEFDISSGFAPSQYLQPFLIPSIRGPHKLIACFEEIASLK